MYITPLTFFFIAMIYYIHGNADDQVSCKLEDDCVNVLRRQYFSMNYAEAFSNGKTLLNRFPSSSKIRAWYLLAAAKGDKVDQDTNLAVDKINSLFEGDIWSKFALVGWKINDGDDAFVLEASETVWSNDPKNSDFIWLRSEALRLRGKKTDAINFLKMQGPQLHNSPELLIILGSAYYDLWLDDRQNNNLREFALQSFNEAIELDPNYVRAKYVLAWFYTHSGEPTKSIKLIEPIIGKTHAPKIHFAYWSALLKSSDITEQAKKEKIRSDINNTLELWKNDPATIYAASQVFDDIHDTAQRDKLEDLLLQKYSDDIIYEQVFMRRLARLAGDNSPQSINQQKKELLSYLQKYEQLNKPEFVGEAYLRLLEIYHMDSTVPSSEVLRVAKGVVENYKEDPERQYFRPAIALLDKGIFPEYAEEISKRGQVASISFAKANERRFASEYAKTEYLQRLSGLFYYAIGFAELNQQKNEQAEADLQRSVAEYFQSPACKLLAEIYSRHKNYKMAEKYYLAGLESKSISRKEMEDIYSQLKNIYQSRKGSLDGYAEYIAKIDEKFERILASNVESFLRKSPEHFDGLKLINTKGVSFNTAALQGRNVILYFWTSHCAYCIESLTEIAALSKLLENDPDSKIFNINLDYDPVATTEFLRSHNINLSVFLPETESSVHFVERVPIMIVIDRNGDIIYSREGANPNLFNETVLLIKKLNGKKIAKVALSQ